MRDAAWEAEVVAQARQGRPGAYAKLVVRYTPPVRHAVFKIVRDHDRARELTQQAFAAAWEHLDQYDPDHRFFSWVYRIAVNRALNAVRDLRHTCSLEGFDPPDRGPNPEEGLLAVERADQLRAALRTLPVPQRILLSLRYDLDLDYAEISRILDLPGTTVKSRLHTARARLRREVDRRERASSRPWPDAGRPPARGRKASAD